MDSQIKKEWCVKLRSGQYTQARREFRDCDGGFCCLAVLADLYIEKTEKGFWGDDDGVTFKHETAPPSNCTEPIWEWSGLSTRDRNTLINLNDVERYNFEQIADYVEENF
jgi:hypothetical protein